MRVLTGGQMQEADRRTIDAGTPAAALMARAGAAVADAVLALRPQGGVALVCGRGNNGGDGFVAARVLRRAGVDARVFLLGGLDQIRDDARQAADACLENGPIVEVRDHDAWRRHRPAVVEAAVIVDAIVGTGFTPPLTGLAAAVVDDINASGRPIVAVDVPSGLSADTGNVAGPSIHATRTVALGAPKLAHVLSPASDRVGDWAVADIGITGETIDAVTGPRLDLVTPAVARMLLPMRRRDAHKGDFGHVLIVAGSRGKTGAAYLAAMAALRSGAGLVTLATPASCLPSIAALGAEYMTLPLAEDDGVVTAPALDTILAFTADVIAVGPGLGQTDGVRDLVRGLVTQVRAPLVIDADGLNAVAALMPQIATPAAAARVLTPHPGEMARLLGVTTAAIQADRLTAARTLAAAAQAHVILKGRASLIAAPDGRVAINSTGNPGMATGGTGDVLTGAVAAWLGQLRDAMSAAVLATWIHGRAGDLAAGRQGEIGMIAGDLLAHLGPAARDLSQGSPS